MNDEPLTFEEWLAFKPTAEEAKANKHLNPRLPYGSYLLSEYFNAPGGQKLLTAIVQGTGLKPIHVNRWCFEYAIINPPTIKNALVVELVSKGRIQMVDWCLFKELSPSHRVHQIEMFNALAASIDKIRGVTRLDDGRIAKINECRGLNTLSFYLEYLPEKVIEWLSKTEPALIDRMKAADDKLRKRGPAFKEKSVPDGYSD